MTITCPNGTVLNAILLSRGEDQLRATVAGYEDALAFIHVHGCWFSEEGEPVTIAFEWQRRAVADVPAECDCVCPMELAARLISMLHGDSDPEQAKSRVSAASACASAQAN
jgi:hypothetical protein